MINKYTYRKCHLPNKETYGDRPFSKAAYDLWSSFSCNLRSGSSLETFKQKIKITYSMGDFSAVKLLTGYLDAAQKFN
jgi:hypothetical protein